MGIESSTQQESKLSHSTLDSITHSSRKHPELLIDALSRTLSELPSALQASCIELRGYCGENMSSIRLAHSALIKTKANTQAALSHEDLHKACTHAEPAILQDLDPNSSVKSWIIIPFGEALPDGRQLQVFIGSRASTELLNQMHWIIADLISPMENYSKLVHSLPLVSIPAPLHCQSIECIPQPMLLCDRDGCLLSMNSNFLFLLSNLPKYMSDKPSQGLPLADFLPPSYLEVFQEAHENTLERHHSVEVPLPVLSGSLSIFQFTLSTSELESAEYGTVVAYVLRDYSAGIRLSNLEKSVELHASYLEKIKSDTKIQLNMIQDLSCELQRQANKGKNLDHLHNSLQQACEQLNEFLENSDMQFCPNQNSFEAAFEITTIGNCLRKLPKSYEVGDSSIPCTYSGELDAKIFLKEQDFCEGISDVILELVALHTSCAEIIINCKQIGRKLQIDIEYLPKQKLDCKVSKLHYSNKLINTKLSTQFQRAHHKLQNLNAKLLISSSDSHLDACRLLLPAVD